MNGTGAGFLLGDGCGDRRCLREVQSFCGVLYLLFYCLVLSYDIGKIDHVLVWSGLVWSGMMHLLLLLIEKWQPEVVGTQVEGSQKACCVSS